MLQRNELLAYTQPRARTLRILWIDPRQRHAYLFDVAGQGAEVERWPLTRIRADLEAGRAMLLASDPHLVVTSQELLPLKHRQLRDRAWEIIAPLVVQEPAIYSAQLRGALVAQATRLHKVSHPTVYRYLRRYWQRGQTPNALLPDYANSGGRGKVRQASEGVKRGRPRKHDSEASAGINVDDAVRRVMRVAVLLYVASHARFSRQGAYRQMLADFFSQRDIDAETGRIRAVQAAPATCLPSFGQFNYWLDQDDDRPAEVGGRKSLQTTAAALPDQLALTLITSGAGRPGAAFCLTVRQLELQLVSRANRLQTIGRPWLYLVSDEASQMITGFYVGLGEVSRAHAMLALAHCGADKVAFCQRYGRPIEAAHWPVQHLPARLHLAAELAAELATELAPESARGAADALLLNNFNLPVDVAPEGPQAWQAVLERRFRLLAPDASAMPGLLDGVLDLDQLHRLLVDAILYYNNRTPVDQATPRQRWQHGLATRGNALKTYPEQLLRCSLLPVSDALVTCDGISLRGQLYTCARAIEERWFERARTRAAWSVRVAYDPANLDIIYLLDAHAPMQFHTCHMLDNGAVQHLSEAELALLPRSAPAYAPPSLRATTHSYASFVN